LGGNCILIHAVEGIVEGIRRGGRRRRRNLLLDELKKIKDTGI